MCPEGYEREADMRYVGKMSRLRHHCLLPSSVEVMESVQRETSVICTAKETDVVSIKGWDPFPRRYDMRGTTVTDFVRLIALFFAGIFCATFLVLFGCGKDSNGWVVGAESIPAESEDVIRYSIGDYWYLWPVQDLKIETEHMGLITIHTEVQGTFAEQSQTVTMETDSFLTMQGDFLNTVMGIEFLRISIQDEVSEKEKDYPKQGVWKVDIAGEDIISALGFNSVVIRVNGSAGGPGQPGVDITAYKDGTASNDLTASLPWQEYMALKDEEDPPSYQFISLIGFAGWFYLYEQIMTAYRIQELIIDHVVKLAAGLPVTIGDSTFPATGPGSLIMSWGDISDDGILGPGDSFVCIFHNWWDEFDRLRQGYLILNEYVDNQSDHGFDCVFSLESQETTDSEIVPDTYKKITDGFHLHISNENGSSEGTDGGESSVQFAWPSQVTSTYQYSGGIVVGITHHLGIDVTKGSGNMRITAQLVETDTAKILDEISETFVVEQGNTYQFSVSGAVTGRTRCSMGESLYHVKLSSSSASPDKVIRSYAYADWDPVTGETSWYCDKWGSLNSLDLD